MQKSELLHEKGNVMLAYSGGHSSSALVHLAHYFINNNVHRYKKFAAFIVCHVDESALTAEDSKVYHE